MSFLSSSRLLASKNKLLPFANSVSRFASSSAKEGTPAAKPIEETSQNSHPDAAQDKRVKEGLPTKQVPYVDFVPGASVQLGEDAGFVPGANWRLIEYYRWFGY